MAFDTLCERALERRAFEPRRRSGHSLGCGGVSLRTRVNLLNHHERGLTKSRESQLVKSFLLSLSTPYRISFVLDFIFDMSPTSDLYAKIPYSGVLRNFRYSSCPCDEYLDLRRLVVYDQPLSPLLRLHLRMRCACCVFGQTKDSIFYINARAHRLVFCTLVGECGL